MVYLPRHREREERCQCVRILLTRSLFVALGGFGGV